MQTGMNGMTATKLRGADKKSGLHGSPLFLFKMLHLP
jgi:hypothetical protein